MKTHTHPELSSLAQAILDDKWIMTTPEMAIGYAIDEFIYMTVSSDYEYTYDDKEVTSDEFSSALTEIVRYVTAKRLWGTGMDIKPIARRRLARMMGRRK